MDVVIKVVGVVGGVITVGGLISVLLGWNEFRQGISNEDSRSSDKGSQKMVMGGATALITGGITTAIIVALNAIKF